MKTKPLLIMVLLFGLAMAREAQAFYNPTLGNWLSRDPLREHAFAEFLRIIELAPGLNEFAFVGNDSISGFDVLGQGVLCYCVYGCKPGRLVANIDSGTGLPSMDGGVLCNASTLGQKAWRSNTSVCNNRMFVFEWCYDCSRFSCTFACEYDCVKALGKKGNSGYFWKSTGKSKLVTPCP